MPSAIDKEQVRKVWRVKRRNPNWSQSQIADYCHIGRRTLQRYVNNSWLEDKRLLGLIGEEPEVAKGDREVEQEASESQQNTSSVLERESEHSSKSMPASEAREALGSRGEDTDDTLRVQSAFLRIETYPLRRWVERPEGVRPNPQLEMEIEFVWLLGHGRVMNEVRVELDEDVRIGLREICDPTPRYLHILLDGARMPDESIRLEPGSAEQITRTKAILLRHLPTKDDVKRLDECSVMIEEGKFTIHWQQSQREDPSQMEKRSFRLPPIKTDTPGTPT